ARLRAIDPSVEPRSSRGERKAASDDLIFIDLGEPAPRRSGAMRIDNARAAAPPAPPAPPPAAAPTRAPTPAASTDPIFIDLSSDSHETPLSLDVVPTEVSGVGAAGNDAAAG